MHIMRPVPPSASGRALFTALHGLPKCGADPALPQPSPRILEGSQPHPEQTQKLLSGYKRPAEDCAHLQILTLLGPPYSHPYSMPGNSLLWVKALFHIQIPLGSITHSLYQSLII